MKRIEEFTVDEIVKAIDPTWSTNGEIKMIIDYIKANLDTGKREPMSVEEIARLLYEAGYPVACKQVATVIQPLTVQQGFVVDWSKAPEWATSIIMLWSRNEEHWGIGPTEFNRIPRPAPKMRQKTNFEKLHDWTEWKKQKRKESGYDDSPYYASQLLAEELVEGKPIDDLCRDAGIPLETQE